MQLTEVDLRELQDAIRNDYDIVVAGEELEKIATKLVSLYSALFSNQNQHENQWASPQSPE